jgi:hypothetical protein
MAEYRAYIVGDDGHFTGFEGLVCSNDSQAIENAKRLVDGHDIELWCGERFVKRLNVDDKPRTNSYEVIQGRMVQKPAAKS